MKQTKVFVVMALMSVMSTVAFAQAPKNNQSVTVSRARKVIDMTTREDTLHTTQKRNIDVPFDYKKANVDSGNEAAIAFDNHNKDIEGKKLSRAFIGLTGGLSYQFDGAEIQPEGRLLIGREAKSLVFFADLFLSGKKQNESDAMTANGVKKGASYTGTYLTYGGKINVGVKLLQNDRYTSWLAGYGGAGYANSTTDVDDAEVVSSNSGLLYGCGLLGKAALGKHWGVMGQIEFGNITRCYHDSKQDLGNFALKFQFGAVYTF